MWIRIQCLPIELYNNIFLNRIGMSLEKFLKVDRLTLIHFRGKFARLGIELDLEKPLETHIYLHGFMLNLEYEGRKDLEKDTNISGEDATSMVADAKVHEEPRAGINMSSKPLIIME
ncbi:hypothetical protein JHK84_031684 [Glycine max]|nr:hypothetical protein JHK87_031378 [Glycine soja]KAG5146141.1 hypothetical protein JHK84_031684 [Glycine max]